MMSKEQQASAIANKLSGGPSAINESRVPEDLQDIILRHQVSYEVWPDWSGCGGRAKRIGYCISICGVNDGVDCGGSHHVPGCAHCALTYGEIRKVAEWITLKERPDCRFQIDAFDRAWHIAPRQRWSRNEIVVNIKILHSRNVDGPVKESQESCLNELRLELKRLGVREGVWQITRVAVH